jgi:hypothetical protein
MPLETKLERRWRSQPMACSTPSKGALAGIHSGERNMLSEPAVRTVAASVAFTNPAKSRWNCRKGVKSAPCGSLGQTRILRRQCAA